MLSAPCCIWLSGNSRFHFSNASIFFSGFLIRFASRKAFRSGGPSLLAGFSGSGAGLAVSFAERVNEGPVACSQSSLR